MMHSSKRNIIQTMLCCVIVSLLFATLTGCTTRFMSVKEGDFDVTLHPELKGAEYNMKENSSIRRVAVNIHKIENQKTKLSKVWTGSAFVCDGDVYCSDDVAADEILEPGRADISYVFKSWPVSISLEWLEKSQIRFISYGFGLDPAPYGKVSVGLNGRWGEIGMAAYLGFDYSNTNYVYEGISASGCNIQTCPEPTHDISSYNNEQFHLRGGFGGYASVFFGSFALTYSPSVQSPWLWTIELGGDPSGFADWIPPSEYELTFEFPFYFSHYFGFTWTYREKMQFSAGLTVVNGIQLKERLYFGSGSIAYLF